MGSGRHGGCIMDATVDAKRDENLDADATNGV